jgi:hypothetical protein
LEIFGLHMQSANKPRRNRRNKTTKPYVGILTTPIHIPVPRLEFDGAVTRERGEEFARARDRQLAIWNQQVEAARNERLEALFAHFELPLGEWRSLALSLAEEHVRGFQFAAKRGPKPGNSKWAPWELEILRGKVEEVQTSKPGTLTRSALRHLLKKDEWVKSKRVKLKTLESRYQDAKAQAKSIQEWAISPRP